jgi:RIP metalloprotease RseP
MQSFAPLFSNTWGILVLILFFGGSIFIHELGHYLAAKWRKLKIERFSIGFGPRLFGWKNKDGVDFRISLLPLGGYVALPQLADMGRLEGDQNEDGDEGEEALPYISYADKVIVSAAGAVFNIIFALAVGSLIWVIGQPSSEGQQTTVIGYVSPTLLLDRHTEVEGPGHKAGLLPGDQVQAIDGRKIRDFYDMQHSIVTGAGRTQDEKPQTIFTILRDGQQKDVTIEPVLITINPASGDKVRQIGILPATHVVSQLVENSPAHKAGLKLNDRIVSVNGQPVFSIPAIREHLKKSGDQSVTLGIERDGKAIALQIQPQLKAERKTTLTLRIPNEANPLALHFLPKYAETPTEVPPPETLAELILFEIEGNPEQSGFQPRIGDVLIQIGKNSISSIQDVETAVKESINPPTVLSLQSGDILRNLNLPETTQIKIEPVVIQPRLGFIMGGETRIHLNPLTQIRRHFNTTLQVLGSLLNRNSDIGVQQLSGPIGIGRVFHRYANIDFRLVLVFAVLLNINLAILNMLPIPVLDGGHILFATVAKFRKKGLPINFIVRIQTVFVLLLFSMIIYVGVYDSLRWKGDNQEERRYEILSSLYFDPAILTTAVPDPPNNQEPSLDGEAVK